MCSSQTLPHILCGVVLPVKWHNMPVEQRAAQCRPEYSDKQSEMKASATHKMFQHLKHTLGCLSMSNGQQPNHVFQVKLWPTAKLFRKKKKI